MSYKQMTGNIISATKVEPDGIFISSAASGVWNLQDQYDYVRGGNWPNAANANPTGLIAGGTDGSNVKNEIQKINFISTGDAIDFGDLTVVTNLLGACASATRGLFGGGSPSNKNVISYVTISSAGNATDFGDLTSGRTGVSAFSSATRGIWVGGEN